MSNGKGEAYFSVRVRLGVGGEVGGGGGRLVEPVPPLRMCNFKVSEAITLSSTTHEAGEGQSLRKGGSVS